MKNDPLIEQLRQRGWRHRLTAREESDLREWLAADPEAQADWEAETGLNEALNRLRNIPVANSFTAQTVAAALRAAADEERSRRPAWQLWQWRLRWLPKAALASVLLSGVLVSYHKVQVARRLDLAQGVASVAEFASAPTAEIMADFTAIQAMAQPPTADDELIRLLQ